MIKPSPQLFTADHLKEWSVFCKDKVGGKYVFCRPEDMSGWTGLKNRFKLAWGVFTGKYGALKWMNNQ